jgi:hypothetical protein
MNEQEPLVESRWLVLLAILALSLLLATIPHRVHILPRWVNWSFVLMVTGSLIAVTLSAQKALWLRIERIAIAFFFAYFGLWVFLQLKALLGSMVQRTGELSGIQLLMSSISLWAANVVIFSIAYWRIDRGGPEARQNKVRVRPDWIFPQEGVPDLQHDWRPSFVDYLFIGFTTATAFSPTDALPLSHRAKLLMMVECLISLVTLIAVAARAINTLGV